MNIRDVWFPRDMTVIVVYPAAEGKAYGNRLYAKDIDGVPIMFGHLEELPPYSPGDIIPAKTVIGRMGATGYCPSGPHLHVNRFNIGCTDLHSYNAINPLSYFKRWGYPCYTIITNYFGSNVVNPKLKKKGKKHEGLDFSSWRKRHEEG